VFSHVELLREHRLDVPQPVELADMLRKSGFPMPEGILTPEDCAKAIAAILEKK